MYSLGNENIFQNHKVTFLCSRRCPANIVLKSYDWAVEQRKKGQCVISGFHSKIEKDVLHLLLKGNQPVILVLARGLKKRLEPELQKAIDRRQLLIVTPFSENVKQVTSGTSLKRNKVMIEMANEVVVAYARPEGMLNKLLLTIEEGKVTIL